MFLLGPSPPNPPSPKPCPGLLPVQSLAGWPTPPQVVQTMLLVTLARSWHCQALWSSAPQLVHRIRPGISVSSIFVYIIHKSVGLLHWLHVNPNSDHSTFRHFFGKFLEEFWQIFCSYWADILPWNSRLFVICHFLGDKLHLAVIQHFLAKFWHILFCVWQTFGI